ncbi:hydantoinase B/oxoprolinase family protein [Lignipirellula cremea]|uniref:Acetophenone carboxylase gamma subunit n=1 Tax=Lignipirellula cremea TaxID=2528010 RepID=A0A518DW95_9BACT|nr:hydantoinase B/oxoprolinase family protein [Lignipirellula cremea]QDU96111.1 Acetophenone carboxylase gamma subunit [Lignipirellula cremea]
MAWQFWIDVGGTFTDCFGRTPQGELRRCKVLSSAATKGTAAAGSSAAQIIDPSRQGDPPGFWNGYRLRIINASGEVLDETEVTDFDTQAGMLGLARSLTGLAEGCRYELQADQPAPILAIRWLLGLPLQEPIPPVSVRLGATRGTNALLTRQGARTAMVATRGFADILRIGYQNRPRLFELDIVKPAPLFSTVIEANERIAADGSVLQPLHEQAVAQQLQQLHAEGYQSLAVCLLNAYASAEHEQAIGRLAEAAGFAEVSLSSDVSPLAKLVSRGDTTVVDAYLTPVLRTYVQDLQRRLAGSDLRLLTSAGGLVDAARFTGKDSILSGPAGGVVGFSRVAQAAGFEKSIGFDMGGTSTDVSRFDGRFELEFETEKAGVRIVAPTMAIETVAAGGGSICAFDGVKLVVGPASAGSDPGPACYGRGGPLTITDINFYLGKILPDRFPFPLDRTAVERRLARLIEQITDEADVHYEPQQLADGFLQIANGSMASAIRTISLAKGYDPREYVLTAFGGAAPQHACAVAEELAIPQVLNHPDAGILSAYGIGVADIVRHRAIGVYRLLPDCQDELPDLFRQAAAEALAEVEIETQVESQGRTSGTGEAIELQRSLDLRYQGLDAWLPIPEPEGGDYVAAYTAEHQRLYGFTQDRPLEVVAVRVEATARNPVRPPASRRADVTRRAVPAFSTPAHFRAQPCDCPVYERNALRPGDQIAGPAIVLEAVSTTVIDPGWQAEMLTAGELLLTRPASLQSRLHGIDPQEADPVLLELFNNQFAAVAEQMGVRLRRTSSSVNVKERLDFSCAVFTSTGDLVVNAPHIPVHLGAMSETVKCILADNPHLQPGDVLVTNDPYRGGSHLPDVTVVTPVHDRATGQLLFVTASRAHHAEIGGMAPGSMPPFSHNLAEEGVLIQNFKLIDGGKSRRNELRELLGSGPFPSRNVDLNLADIDAQIAANLQGSRDLLSLVERYSLPVVQGYMGHIQQAAERKMRAALARLPDGRREFVDYVDDHSRIAVAVTITGDAAVIDFAGSAEAAAGNLNANRAIVTAAAMYCLRCLLGEDIPLNQGVLAPVEIRIPPGLLNPQPGATPADSPAVAGGNVETSQRVVDVLLGALGLAAASQGTMNNLLFGDGSFGYYETICGGAGATPQADGADAVHTHMTNTRLTDPEVLEQRYPARVRRFEIRRGSGGQGEHRGGDGVIREIEFLAPLEVSLLTTRRGVHPPYGLAGGLPGKPGRNCLQRAGSGEIEELPAITQISVQVGDRLTLETPGGGGFGPAPKTPS